MTSTVSKDLTGGQAKPRSEEERWTTPQKSDPKLRGSPSAATSKESWALAELLTALASAF